LEPSSPCPRLTPRRSRSTTTACSARVAVQLGPAAVDAANPGDTIAVCPGRLRGRRRALGSNALTITKSLTIQGGGRRRRRESSPAAAPRPEGRSPRGR